MHPYELSGGSIAAGESVLVWGRAVQAVEAKRSIYVDFGRAERLLDAPTSEETAQDLARYFVGEPSKDALSANVGVLGTGCACGVATSLVGGYDTHVASGYMSTYCEEVFTHYPDFREGFLYALWNEGIFEEEDYEPLSPELPTESPLYTTLVVALRDYVRKNGFSKVVLGLSGGIDSALVTSLAVDALGAENVRVLFMRTGFTSETSEQGVREIVKNMGLTLHDFSFTELFDTTVGFLEKAYGVSLPWDVTEENIQARLRALFVMAFSNKFNELALCTSNKSEAAMGYGTLYGDITGGFAPLIDLWKGQIVELCRERNAEAQGEWIPELIITREPSAELRAGQKDSDALPPYDTIEEVLEVFLSTRSSAGITDVDPSLVESIIRRTLQNQFKRAQGIPGPVVSKTPLSLLGDFGLTYQSPKAR